ncbi:MAG: cbb3-type cytochrome c oxidase subunit 3 [Alphaproteobacteria bacterium]
MGNEHAFTHEAFQGVAATVGLILFIVAFALVLIYAFLPSNKKTFDRASRLPLDKDLDDNSPRGQNGQS